MLIANKVLTANKIDNVKGGSKLIEKFIEPKTGKLSKFQKVPKSKKF